MSLRLENKIALVTGAGSGIGLATAKRFAEEGAQVILTDINGESVEAAVAEIISSGGKATALFHDVTNENLWSSIVDSIITEHGRLDVLVNNAGIAIPANVEEDTLENWRAVHAVNSEGVFLGCRAAIPAMKEHGGSIINISSIEGIVGEPNVPSYNASKGGVRIFTKSVALHCAKNGYAIRANSVHPGFIATPLVANSIASMEPVEAQELQERLMREIPVGAMGEPLDVANACLYLASDESKYMTGSELVIDGGYTCH